MKIFIAICLTMLINWSNSFKSYCQNFDVHNIPLSSLKLEAALYLKANYENKEVTLLLEKAQQLKASGNFNDAYENLIRIEYENLIDSFQQKTLYETVLCALLAGRNTDAAYYTVQYNNYVKDSVSRAKLDWIRPLIYLQNEEWTNAKNAMKKLIPLSKQNEFDSIWKSDFPKYKNGRTAKLLNAFLPGSGQIYGNRVLFGLVNLIGFAASGYFIYWHIVQHYYAIAAITGGGWLSRFYIGGLKTTKQTIETKNDYKTKVFQQKMSAFWLKPKG